MGPHAVGSEQVMAAKDGHALKDLAALEPRMNRLEGLAQFARVDPGQAVPSGKCRMAPRQL